MSGFHPGKFVMGCAPGDRECDADETPAHEVVLSTAFWMGETEVTVRAWKLYASETGRPMPPEPKSG
ncbi:MAG: SUMF1/EgtB/PvdO family nonheme iron enzyme [Bryobacteraceae bacterium]